MKIAKYLEKYSIYSIGNLFTIISLAFILASCSDHKEKKQNANNSSNGKKPNIISKQMMKQVIHLKQPQNLY